jgi:azurin/glucose/arabinose dehydrogenase
MLLVGVVLARAQAPAKLELKPEDHVVLIGNALADRMQHTGWFETLVQTRFPDHKLVFRNLAVAGDEVAFRHRSENFGSPDDWLKKTSANVVLAFFGFNESVKGPDGLAKFRADLDKELKHLQSTDFSGKGAPKVVLISPVANERHQDKNYPDPTANNKNLELYTAAMAEVAQSNGVQFVDVFHPSLKLFTYAAARSRSLTVNGLYLNDDGDKALAPVLFEGLFREKAPRGNREKLRAAINEKNAQWHARYRSVDGYNVYGGRSALAYQPDKGGFISDRNAPAPYVSNYKVMQEEMSQRDVLTANRDRHVWSLAKGKDSEIDDSNLPPVTQVPTNKRGTKEDGSYTFLSGEAAISKMTVHSGMKVNLFASEEQFPELANPVQMAWDTKGRLWVAAWPNYPERTPDSKVGDSLLIFEDTDGDGRADKVTHFIDDLNCPTGFQFYKDGVLIMQAPDLWFVRDTDGDGKADWKERVLMGMDSADSHHTANAICLDPGGSIYLSDGVFHRTQVETSRGPVRNNDGSIYRFEPRTGDFTRYAPYGFANPHGRVFDRWGNDIVTDATGNANYFGAAFSGHIDYPASHSGMKEFWNRPSRPCPGTGILSSRHFPEEFQNNFINLNVISFQGAFRVKVSEEGSGIQGETLENLISSTDPNFRPSAISVGPDGALYFTDWHKPLIGHMQHHLRDPNRDKTHGRIYRITYPGRPLLKPAKISGQPIEALLELLKSPENGTRELAKVELGRFDSAKVSKAVTRWAAALDKNDPDYEHHMMEALWVHQWHNVVNVELLQRMLKSSDHRARAAATRVLCYWRDRVPDALGLFEQLAADAHPRVRLEAVRAASFFSSTKAVDVALTILTQPTDYYLEYTLKETLRQLDPIWRKALAAGEPVAANNPAGFRHLMSSLSAADLQKLQKTPTVLEAVLTRAETADADRTQALDALAKARKQKRAAVVISALENGGTAPVARLLPWQDGKELKAERARVEALATKGSSPEIRAAAWAALAVADDGFDAAWASAAKTASGLTDLMNGIPSLLDPDFRAKAAAMVRPVLQQASGDGAQRRAAIRALVSFPGDAKGVFSTLTALIANGQEVATAAQGLRTVPRADWPKSEAGVAAKALVAWAKQVPASGRTAQDYVETVQFASDLAGTLDPSDASALRAELKAFRVPVFVVRTVREQLRFDTPRLVVEAGKSYEIIVENGDFMPHNLVIVKPGSREAIGNATATMKPDERDGRGRPYVPRGNANVLAATQLLEAGQKETLKLTAPATEGTQEFVCTFPGHFTLMWGTIVVTKDVDAYLAAHPDAPPGSSGAGGKLPAPGE